MKTNRRQFLASTAVLAAMSATMGTLLPDSAFAQTAKTRDLIDQSVEELRRRAKEAEAKLGDRLIETGESLKQE